MPSHLRLLERLLVADAPQLQLCGQRNLGSEGRETLGSEYRSCDKHLGVHETGIARVQGEGTDPSPD